MLLQLHNGERELLSELKAAAQKRAGKRSYVTAAGYNHTAHPATPLHNLREGAFGGYTQCEGGVLYSAAVPSTHDLNRSQH